MISIWALPAIKAIGIKHAWPRSPGNRTPFGNKRVVPLVGRFVCISSGVLVYSDAPRAKKANGASGK